VRIERASVERRCSRGLFQVTSTLLLALLCACAAPVGVQPISPRQARRELTKNFLSTGKLSEKARIVLRRIDMDQEWEEEPAEVVATLLSRITRPMNEFDARLRSMVMDSVAELAFAYASESDIGATSSLR
jgi:hypothetical protein